MSRAVGITVGLLLFVCSVFIATVTYKFVHFWMSPVSAGPTKMIFYEVKTGVPAATIASDLENLGIISSARLFYWYGRLSGKSRKFKAGDYRFSTKMRPAEVISVIMSGVSYGYPLVVPEGYTMYQVAELMENFRPGTGERFLHLCVDRGFIAKLGLFGTGSNAPLASLEGYLFPDTYLIGRRESEDEIVRRMVRKYRSVFTVEMGNRARAMGLSEHQVVTLASIVEKETGARHERPVIASVFHNRLKKRMRLQSDPTVIYGVRDFNGNITRRDLETATPYNTYKIKGLPPGPISNPGKGALLAALYPAQTEFLYFVSHNDGTHEFTSTYDDHRKAVAKFQLDRTQREGRSWRDLKAHAQKQRVQ